MNNQANFTDTLRSVAEIVRVSGEPVKREDIKNYFGDMNLTKEQEEMVYQYLLHPPVDEPTPEEEEEEKAADADYEEEDLVQEEQPAEEQKLSESLFFQMYMEDIEELPKISEEEEMALYESLLGGDNYVVSAIADHWLRKVIEHAKTYQNRNVLMEDLIQEGNIGLLCGIQSLVGASITAKEVPAALLDSINQAMVEFIDEYCEEEDLETTVLAKTNLIYEAKKALAETLGHEPSMEELCNYTNMPAEEINDIITLAQTKKDK